MQLQPSIGTRMQLLFYMSYTFDYSSFRTYFIFTAAAVVPCGSRKTSPCISSSCRLYIFWSFGLILSQFENRVPLKQLLGGVGSVAWLNCCTWTDLIKQNLLFLFFFDVFLASRGSSFRTYFFSVSPKQGEVSQLTEILSLPGWVTTSVFKTKKHLCYPLLSKDLIIFNGSSNSMTQSSG